MKIYTISFKYSRNGTTWQGMSTSVKADSSQGAIMQIKSRFPYVKDIRIISARYCVWK